MCIGLPMQVVEAEDFRALCRGRGNEVVWIDTTLVGPQVSGVWLLTFNGAARDVMTSEQAMKTLDALSALETIQAGGVPDLDALFADLVETGPQLPEFLRSEHIDFPRSEQEEDSHD